MKHLLLAAAALFAVGGAASAQPYRGEARQLEQRIDRAAQNGALSRREAQALRAQVNGVQRLEWQYSRNGLNRWEMSDLQRRYDSIRLRLRIDRNDRDRAPGGGWR